MSENIPKDFYRGVSSPNFICDEMVLPDAFQFEDTNRVDNYLEASINWNDDENSLSLLMEQRKANGEIQFAAGAIKINVKDLHKFCSSFIEKKILSYERSPIENNSYHGNLLISKNAHKRVRNMAIHALAMLASNDIILR